jgi:hypothetical protein
VPIHFFENSPTHGLAVELRSSLSDELLGSNVPLHFYSEDGEPKVSMFKGKGYSGAAAELWRIVNFDDRTIRAFAAELRDLMDKYEGLSKNGRPYLIHAAYAPRRHR